MVTPRPILARCAFKDSNFRRFRNESVEFKPQIGVDKSAYTVNIGDLIQGVWIFELSIKKKNMGTI